MLYFPLNLNYIHNIFDVVLIENGVVKQYS